MNQIIRTAAFGLTLLLLASCSSGPYQASPEALQQRAQVIARYGTTIVPGRSIGPIHLGMGMDEVQALLGKPDSSDVFPNGDVITWYYFSMNLAVRFNGTATPSVNSIWTEMYTKSDGETLGQQTWDGSYPVQTAYKTDKGIQLGSTSFDVQRAYGSNYVDQGSSGLMMIYDSSGIAFRVTHADRLVVAITVSPPGSW